MGRAFQWTRRIVDRLTMALNVAGTFLIVALMILINSDVIGRGVLGSPISGVPEMVSMSIVAIVFLQVAQAFRMGRFTRTDAVLNALSKRAPRVKAALELIFCLAGFGIISVLLYASYPLFIKAWDRDTYVGTVGDFIAPVWPVKLIILIGCAALLMQLAMATISAFITMWRAGGDDAESIVQESAHDAV